MKKSIILLATISILNADSSSYSANNITSMLKQQLSQEKQAKKEKNTKAVTSRDFPDWLRGSYHASNVPNSRKITDVIPKEPEPTEEDEFTAWVKKQPRSVLDD